MKYGFVSAGGGEWYTRTLGMLEPESRVWVNVPGHGYVGVGRVTESVVPVDEFTVKGDDGETVQISTLPLDAPAMCDPNRPPEKREHLVRVDWVKPVPVDAAVKEKGFFGNQNSAARPTSKKWVHTVERLKKRFGVEE